MDLLRGDVAKGIIEDLTRGAAFRGGGTGGCSVEQLHESDL